MPDRNRGTAVADDEERLTSVELGQGTEKPARWAGEMAGVSDMTSIRGLPTRPSGDGVGRSSIDVSCNR